MYRIASGLPDNRREPPPGGLQPHDPRISYTVLSDSGDSLSGSESCAGSGERDHFGFTVTGS